MVRAFQQVLEVARREAELLPHLLAAAVCLLAHEEAISPRSVLEGAYFRRSVSDQRWQGLPTWRSSDAEWRRWRGCSSPKPRISAVESRPPWPT